MVYFSFFFLLQICHLWVRPTDRLILLLIITFASCVMRRVRLSHTSMLWIPCPRNQHAYWNSRNPELASTTFSEASLRDVGKLSCPRPRHKTFSTFPRRILRGGLLEDSSGWCIVRSTLAATTSSRLRSHVSDLLWSSPILSRLSPSLLVDSLVLVRLVPRILVTLSRHSSTARSLFYRRETWVHDSPYTRYMFMKSTHDIVQVSFTSCAI